MRKALIFLLLAVAMVGGSLWGLSRLAGVPIAPSASLAPPLLPSAAPAASSDDVEKAWAVVRASPSDPDAWAELGNAQQGANDLVAAEHSYRTAVQMGGDNGDAYARLGFLLYAADDNRALSYLLEARRRHSSLPLLDHTISVLGGADGASIAPIASVAGGDSAKAALPPDTAIASAGSATGSPNGRVCTAPITPVEGRNTKAIRLTIDGSTANLVIDTGAGITVLNRAFANSARLEIDRSSVVNAITANGRVQMETTLVKQIVLANRVTQNVRVAVCDACVDATVDGLLGLDLFAGFGLRLDLAKSEVSFADCE